MEGTQLITIWQQKNPQKSQETETNCATSLTFPESLVSENVLHIYVNTFEKKGNQQNCCESIK